MHDYITYLLILLVCGPIAIAIIKAITNLLSDMGIGRIVFFSILGLFVYHYTTSGTLPSFDTDSEQLTYGKNLRLDDDPYSNLLKLEDDGHLHIKNGANVTGLRIEMANVVPVIIDAYKFIAGEDYVPTITSGNDSYVHSVTSKHYDNLALDWRTKDLSRSEAIKITRLIKNELAGIGQYWVKFEEDHIHVHYNRIEEKDKYEDIIIGAAKKHAVEVPLVMAVIHKESAFDADAKSEAGAEGLMQLMPGTAQDMGVTDSYDPRQNVDGGTKYLKKMLKRYNGNVELALAAYNSGYGNIDKAIKRSGSHDWRIVKNNLITKEKHQKETRDYVSRITTYKKVYDYIYTGA